MARYEFTVYQHIVTCLAYFTRVDEANSLLPNHPWRLMILVSILDKYIFWSNLAIHQPASFQSHFVADDFGNIMVNHCKILTVVKNDAYIYIHVTYIYIYSHPFRTYLLHFFLRNRGLMITRFTKQLRRIVRWSSIVIGI